MGGGRDDGWVERRLGRGGGGRTTLRHLWASAAMESAKRRPAQAARRVANSGVKGRARAKMPKASGRGQSVRV